MIARRAYVASMVLVLGVGTAAAQTATPATPGPSPTGPTASATPAVVATATRGPVAAPTSPAWSTSPSPALARPTAIPITDAQPEPLPESGAAPMPVGPAASIAPRVFRTPERAGGPAFVAPRAAAPDTGASDVGTGMGMPPPAPMRQPARGGTRTVVFHAIARTALQGIDLRVTYPRDAGDFVGSADAVDCTAGGGGNFTPNDHDDGTMRLLVASAFPLTFPLDITCRFAVAAGASINARDIGVRVAEVTSNNVRADPGLLSVSVDVR